MQTIQISEHTLARLRGAAALRGLNADVYAEELLALSLAALEQIPIGTSGKRPHRALEFSAAAPTNRTAKDIEDYIRAERDSWDR